MADVKSTNLLTIVLRGKKAPLLSARQVNVSREMPTSIISVAPLCPPPTPSCHEDLDFTVREPPPKPVLYLPLDACCWPTKEKQEDN